MAISRTFITLSFFIFLSKSLTADSNTSFSLKNFGKDSSFDSFLALYGDAKVVHGGSSLQLTAPSASSAGRVIYKRPIKIYGGIPKKLVSFSTHFSFSISNGNSLAFMVFPYGYPLDLYNYNASFGLLSVAFGMNEAQSGIDSSMFVSVKAMNLSSVNLVLNGSERMQTWIDYEAGSRRVEVRLNRFGRKRPIDPVLFTQIDLSKIWPKNEGVFVGLISSNGNSSQTCEIHYWSFKASRAPDWMHSQPLDPMVSNSIENQEHKLKVPKESDCVIKILAALIVGIGCGGLSTFFVMFMWTVFGKRRQPIVPEEFTVKSLQECEHKKLKIVLDEASANEK
ncbi:L-type lectin-domain containing receptor kinase VIII.2-like [Cynara cardunculus var. scolymus]|uniref:Concanavalin A-like lectin/glucanase superfamily n=1 Tax=Cynara cardunculus var. scolymus TaxID=59895 RepID=A0A103XQB3_CYNCS|nr:L-type lectin-domain containing receptor kinase VIII.2-like [Cynara cardunculus var. scolymus]KVH94865.1 Concanavalin A-like lectin/glucanase superfamily [Cynara cardunculus var. scolymus]